MMWFIFAAQETPIVDDLSRNLGFNLAAFHKLNESFFVLSPLRFIPPVIGQHLLGGRENGQMDVFNADDCFEEVSKIVAFTEASQLRNIIESHIDHPLNAGLLQPGEEFVR